VSYPSDQAKAEIMYWSVGGWVMVSGIFLFFGLSSRINPSNKHASPKTIVVEGIKAAKNPRILLSYLASFAARGDSIVLTTYLTLWISHYEDKNGRDEAEALKIAGQVSGIAQVIALVAAPFVGIVIDRIDRVFAQNIASFIAMLGYFGLFLVVDPTGWPIYVAIFFVGVGEIAMIITSQVLLAVESQDETRGAVSGFWGMASGISILVSTKLGGYLFDSWTYTGPFFLVGMFNTVVFIFGVALSICEIYQKRKYNVQRGDEFSWKAHFLTPRSEERL